MEPINILIADDHQMFIDGVKALLRKEKHLHFIGEVHDGVEALDFLAKNGEIDLLIADINMPNMDGVELTKQVKKRYPQIKVLVITMHDDRQIVSEILLAEAEGYILKNTGKEELKKAINYLMEGSTHYSNEIMKILMKRLKRHEAELNTTKPLTDREVEIIDLIVKELTTTEIADKLFISPRTVDSHRKNIMIKTKSKTLVGLIKYAFRNNLTL